MDSEMIPAALADKLSLREAAFIGAYIASSGDGTAAVRKIAPHVKHPTQTAYRMLQRVAVSDAISAIQQKILSKGERTLEKMLERLDAAIALCEKNKQGTAIVRALEIQARLLGYEPNQKVDLNVNQTVDVKGALYDAKRRIQRTENIQDVEFEEVSAGEVNPFS